MLESAHASEPMSADTLPPPGTGESTDVSSTKSRTVLSTSTDGSATRYSMIFCLGSKEVMSLSPSDWIAVSMSSLSGTPVDFPCRAR